MTRRVVLVGNAPLRASIAPLVDGAARVVRFNRARGFGAERGSRTDELYLINHGGQMAEWLARGDLLRQPGVAAAATIVLPVPMLPGHLTSRQARELAREAGEQVDPDRINHLEEAERLLDGAGRAVDRVSVADYRGAQRALATLSRSGAEHYPSTGFVGLFRTLLRARPNERVELCGFTFEGWRGHSWQAERHWVAARADEGRLTVHPVR